MRFSAADAVVDSSGVVPGCVVMLLSYRVSAVRRTSSVPVVLDRGPRSAPGGTRAAAELEQADHAVAVAAPGLEQLEHLGVVDPPAHERPSDGLREVEVADRDGVGVAERALRDLRRGPHADAGHE